MPVRARQLLALAVVALAALWSVAGDRLQTVVARDGAGCPTASDEPRPAMRAQSRAAVLCLVNGHRADAGLPALVEDRALEVAAQAHAEDMGRRNFFEHRDPDGVTPDMRIRRAGFDGVTTGENIAWGMGGMEDTPVRIVDRWMASPGHRANILRPTFTRIGTGIGHDAPQRVAGGRRAGVYVNTFGG